MQHDITYNEPMQRAEADFRAADPRPLAERCPYLWSSNYADAYWITCWALYWGGRPPIALHRSRGHSWRVQLRSTGDARVTVDRPDHREGISILAPAADKAGAA